MKRPAAVRPANQRERPVPRYLPWLKTGTFPDKIMYEKERWNGMSERKGSVPFPQAWRQETVQERKKKMYIGGPMAC